MSFRKNIFEKKARFKKMNDWDSHLYSNIELFEHFVNMYSKIVSDVVVRLEL